MFFSHCSSLFTLLFLVAPLTLFLFALLLWCCSSCYSSRTVFLALSFLALMFLSHYFTHVVVSCAIILYKLLLFSHCLFLHYCSLQVVIPLMLLLLRCCCSFLVVAHFILLFVMLLFFMLFLSYDFSYVVALASLLSHCNSRITPLALELPHDSSHTIAPTLLLLCYCSSVTTLELQYYVRYSSHIAALLPQPLLLSYFFNTYSPSIYCSFHDVVIVPLALLVCFVWFI
jgi:hypothetical protein